MSEVVAASLVIIDECSMVDERLGRDLLSYGTKVLVLGDPAQLPPVRGEGFFTARTPDFTLTEIHRQAADNPIIRMSMTVRQGGRLALQDMAGKPRYVDVDRADLARQGGAPIRERLFREGFKTEDDGEHIAVRCLKAAAPGIEITIVSQPGWHEDQDLPEPVFVGPDGTIAGASPETALELAVATRIPAPLAQAGTLEGWREAAAVAVDVEGCEHWTIGACAAFVGPLLSLTGLDTCGINLSGLSSSGKSTAQRLAVSAWSTPDIRRAGLAYSASRRPTPWKPWRPAPTAPCSRSTRWRTSPGKRSRG